MATGVNAPLLERIRNENLDVYRASWMRLREDVSQEAQIAHDYQGRLVYELLQNADDAIGDAATEADRIWFRLDEQTLWVGNSGRPLTDDDVRGLCGLGASVKSQATGPSRASIGHKGMGFKSVLEITSRPAVYSHAYSFQLDAGLAAEPIDRLFVELGQDRPRHVPVMRLPWPMADDDPTWRKARDDGLNTLFCFPLRDALGAEREQLLANRLLGLPVTSILFLKHLNRIEISVERDGVHRAIGWTVSREHLVDGDWVPEPGMRVSGIHRVVITADDGTTSTFLVAHDAGVDIGDHRAGISTAAWEGIEYSEVSVATPWPPDADLDGSEWQRFHLFLPTVEPCPYRVIPNGAFASDLSRQEIRVSGERDDYNAFLAREVARVLVDELIPEVQREGASFGATMRLLDREGYTGVGGAGIAKVLVDAVRERIGDRPLVPTELGELVPLQATVVPPVLPKDGGSVFRGLLPPDASLATRVFPTPEACLGATAAVLADHGAMTLTARDAAHVLAHADPERSQIIRDPSQPVAHDPVLEMLVNIWRVLPPEERVDFEGAVKAEALFPITVDEAGIIERVNVPNDDARCFYPPRAFQGSVPLGGLSFMLHDLCWGTLRRQERNSALREERPAWQALFGVQEFKFPDVMRASVLPALELDPDGNALTLRSALQSIDQLAAICQLAGRTPKEDATLPYQRLGSDRNLINLARLPVPCRPLEQGDATRWVPAYAAYFGADWIGDESVEAVLEASRSVKGDVPSIAFIVPPGQFSGFLERYRGFVSPDDGDGADDEVSLNEDEEAAFDEPSRDQWLRFLTWLGVNRCLRAVHFDDVGERSPGWLSTQDLATPRARAFHGLGKVWDQYVEIVRKQVAKMDPEGTSTAYFYDVHVLEHLSALAAAAAKDESRSVSRALWAHLARNWGRLERFSRLTIALVPDDRQPSMRAKPVRARSDELKEPLENFWLMRLRSRRIAPTTLGPQKPRNAWLATPEIERRFGRTHRQWPAGNVVPLLDIDEALQRGKARSFANAVGIRDSMSPTTFTADDGRIVLRQLEAYFGQQAETAGLTPELLRQIIRPMYRSLFDLLVRDTDRESGGEVATGRRAPVSRRRRRELPLHDRPRRAVRDAERGTRASRHHRRTLDLRAGGLSSRRSAAANDARLPLAGVGADDGRNTYRVLS